MKYVTSLYLNSNNASSINSTKNRFTVQFNSQIDLSHIKEDLYVRVLSASIFYDSHNINSTNNRIKFTIDGITVDTTLSNGLYSLVDIQETINEICSNAGLPYHSVTLEGDQATSKISYSFSYTTAATIDFNDPNNTLFKNILGFETNGVFTPTFSGQFVDSSHIAKLNTLTSYRIYSDISVGNIIDKNTNEGILCNIDIHNVQVGSVIVYAPFNAPISKLSRKTFSSVHLFITDQHNNDITTNEPINIELQIFHY